MNNVFSYLHPDRKSLPLSAWAGAVVATGVVGLLVSDKVGGLPLAPWQIAAVYVAAMAGSVLLGQKAFRKEPSLYEKIGGEAVVNAAVDIFYRKVLADSRTNKLFEAMGMQEQVARQKAFLVMALGGPNNYTGENKRKGCAQQVARGLEDSHFDAVMEHLRSTFTELKVPSDLIAQAAAISQAAAIAESMRERGLEVVSPHATFCRIPRFYGFP